MRSTDPGAYRIIGNQKKLITSDMRSKMYGWSKFGDANYGLVQENKETSWYCSACGEQLGDTCPCYMFEFEPEDRQFFRICSACQFMKLINHIKSLAELIRMARKHREIWDK